MHSPSHSDCRADHRLSGSNSRCPKSRPLDNWPPGASLPQTPFFRIHRTRLIPVRGENPQIEEGTWVAPARSCRAGRDQRKLRLSNIADILNKTIKAIKIKGSMHVLREICVAEKIGDLSPILVKVIGCF